MGTNGFNDHLVHFLWVKFKPSSRKAVSEGDLRMRDLRGREGQEMVQVKANKPRE